MHSICLGALLYDMPRSTSSFRIVRVLLIVSGLFVVLSPAIRGQSTNLSSKVNGTLPNGSLFRGSAAEITQSNMQGLITVQPKVGAARMARSSSKCRNKKCYYYAAILECQCVPYCGFSSLAVLHAPRTNCLQLRKALCAERAFQGCTDRRAEAGPGQHQS